MSFDAGSLVEDFTAMVDVSFSDLNFTAARGELVINLEPTRVASVRLQLPGTQFLHVHSVDVLDAKMQPLTSGASVRTSSSWKSSDKWIADGRLFASESRHEKGVHTHKDDQPWIEIDLARTSEVHRIVVRNVDTHTSLRARGIQVSVASARDDWQTVYNGTEREHELAAAVETMLKYSPVRHEPGAEELVWLMRDMVVGDHIDVDQRLKALKIFDAEDAARIRSVASERLLASRRLEWTSHGVRRSFRFWSEAEKRRYVESTVQTVRDLEGLTTNACFGFGSVLATVREGFLIPHDDDLDVIVGFEQSEAASLADARELIRAHLTPLGYRVWGEQMAHVFVAKGDSYKIDVFVGLFEGDDIAWYPGTRGSLSRSDMFPVSHGPFYDSDCQLPRNPLAYLERVYGPTWRTPDPGFKHKWGRKPFQDIA
jgi:hypothetical protein